MRLFRLTQKLIAAMKSTPQALKREGFQLLSGTSKEVAEKLVPAARRATTRAEARPILDGLRGPEGPLFHGSACIGEFFRNL
jgi:hypothetical protein